jgi:hypothetical protein
MSIRRLRRFARAAAGAAVAAGCAAPPARQPHIVSFNQAAIDGARTAVDLASPDSVFALVFGNLPPRVTVYPTENYYYFSFNAAGRTVWGNLRLDASDRDRGIIHLGYFRYDETGRVQDREGAGKEFSAADGVRVRRAAPFDYRVGFRGRTVEFRLNQPGWDPPPDSAMAAGEVFVGPVVDESGVRFALVFVPETRHFMYLLDRWHGPVADELEPRGSRLLLGRRTGFAFFADREHHREVLVAVNGRNTERNNYYDGPFDQLPDNYVERTGIRGYIERAYPWARGRVDDFGHFTDQPNARVAITPYYVYDTLDDLAFVESCAGSGLRQTQFYACITPDFQQTYAQVDTAADSATLRVVGEATLTGSVHPRPRR